MAERGSLEGAAEDLAVGGKTRPSGRAKSALREYAEAILIALVLALVVRAFVVQAFKIPSGSMENTLLVGDHILVNKFLYYFTDPGRGDVVVFRYPRDESRDFIKRIVGLPGDVVMVRGRNIYINCRSAEEPDRCAPLRESYAIYNRHGEQGMFATRERWGPERVPAGQYFVMGDNRDNSLDSRAWGFLPAGNLRGKAFLIYWSWDSERTTVRWGRLFSLME